ncbi:ATPase family protein associated with various cellular activities (AAA) [Streptomyces puniciscabiei]|uniref:ATPase family protein associated with various cellular activities (AAA) n=1 Tax=Streptomyces puniciscabiei TaxID=164348 RepID=A0A542U7X1_9ACTN|nr:ATP-binding protein [Streptomyces puniciscabiei]TQK95169.1 ATPase family protein associated with various cellular activities (AAA) [Streptomyces puniciscabiei]
MTYPADVLTAADTDPLWERLRLVEERVRQAVAARRAVDPDPDDPYRGQYLSPEAVDRILNDPGGLDVPGHEPPSPPPDSVLGTLAARFGLSPLDTDLLLIALAPDLDARFERLYGYLNDDLTRRRPTVALALELCGLASASAARFRFAPGAPLVAGGLLEVTEPERPPLSRVLAVPDRVTGHLLGGRDPDARLAGVLGEPADDPTAEGDEVRRAARAARTGTGSVHLLDRGGDAPGLAVAALRAMGLGALVLDAAALARRSGEVPALARVAALEARLTGAGVVLGPLEALPEAPAERSRALSALCTALRGVPLFTHGREGWDPAWGPDTPVVLPVAPPSPDRQAARWRHALALADADGCAADNADALARAVAAHRLDGGQLRRAADAALRSAALAGRPVCPDDLRSAVRAQNGAGLARLARRVEPAVGWDDLVLPEPTHRRLRELAVRARHREQVLGQWRMRPGGGRGRGVIALFAGESGTGKTMSAEVVAADLGMDLYVVDLSTVVDKYVGETEKNLERIFTEASAVNAVLLFDEADAIFGKRSEVKDAHDRHANIESAYLLQRMESFDGIAVLTTNLRANLDEAFTRRLDVVAEFPVPDAAQRLALWDRCLGTRLPRADDLDLGFCADRFELAGGSIRACAVTAAYLAAERGGPLTMRQLVTAVVQEYRKLGRLVLESEFGPYLADVLGA